jgi:hypothetical protein
MRHLLLFALAVQIYAVPVGNPSTPALLEEGFFISDRSWSNPQMAYQGDFLFQKRLRTSAIGGQVTKAEIEGRSQIGEISWSIRERFLLQLELGSGQFTWRWQQSGNAISGRSQDGLIWNGDAKCVIFEAKDTSFSIDLHAGGWDWMRGAVTVNGLVEQTNIQSQFRYWQVAVGMVQKVGILVPYGGVAINTSHFSMYSNGFQNWYKTGPFVGCTLTNGSRFFLNVEWRGWFENGVSVSGQIRF